MNHADEENRLRAAERAAGAASDVRAEAYKTNEQLKAIGATLLRIEKSVASIEALIVQIVIEAKAKL